MQERGVEPLHLAVQDPKSCASANSATPAIGVGPKGIRPINDRVSNLRGRGYGMGEKKDPGLTHCWKPGSSLICAGEYRHYEMLRLTFPFLTPTVRAVVSGRYR